MGTGGINMKVVSPLRTPTIGITVTISDLRTMTDGGHRRGTTEIGTRGTGFNLHTGPIKDTMVRKTWIMAC